MEINHLIQFYRLHQDCSKDIHMLVTDSDMWELIHLLLVECRNLDIHISVSSTHLDVYKRQVSVLK